MRYIAAGLLLYIFGVFLMVSCATPTSPSGGPRDEEGPKITKTNPESGTTNFKKNEIEVSFSEFVERSSLKQAIIIEPDIGLNYSLDWGRKSVAIEFDNKLPDSTTILVTIGTELTDTHNNEMSEPVRIAVSTGPEIDEGEITGRVVDAKTGKGTSGDRIFLYRTPVDLTQKADYLAQTDTSGQFNFTYLSPGEYKVFWVNDQNRSKIWERKREWAQPFYREMVTLDKAGKDSLKTLYKAQSDTTSPSIQGVGLFSTRRMRLRFTENIELTDSTRIIVNDTLGNRYTEALPLYIVPEEQYVLFAESDKDLQAEQSYQLELQNISDVNANVEPLATRQFDGTAQEDTTLQRIIKRTRDKGIFPHEPVEIVYAKPITEQPITDSLIVISGNSDTTGWDHTEVERNILRINPAQETWQQGIDYEIRAWNPSTGRRRSFAPTVWHPADYGSIEFTLEDTTNQQSYRLSLTSDERVDMVDTTFTGSIEIKDLPPLKYKAMIYGDKNNNERWDPGRVQPYQAPEPYFIQRNIPVKQAFTAEVTVVFE